MSSMYIGLDDEFSQGGFRPNRLNKSSCERFKKTPLLCRTMETSPRECVLRVLGETLRTSLSSMSAKVSSETFSRRAMFWETSNSEPQTNRKSLILAKDKQVSGCGWNHKAP